MGLMFAMDDQLLYLEPAIADAVRTGNPVGPPRNVRLLMALTTSERRCLTLPRDGISGAASIDTEGEIVAAALRIRIRVAVTVPPFLLLLVPESVWPGLRYFDLGRWIAQPAGSRRRTCLELSVERTSSRDDLPAIVGPDLREPHRLIRHAALPEGHALLLSDAATTWGAARSAWEHRTSWHGGLSVTLSSCSMKPSAPSPQARPAQEARRLG